MNGPGAPTAQASATKKSRAQALDLIRALAALGVLTYHVWLYRLPNPNRPTRDGWFDYALFELRIGLVVFFVLSGYLLYRPLLGKDGMLRNIRTRDYYRRRIARIVPTYYLAILASIALLWSIGDTPGVRLPDASDLWLFPFFLQNYSSETLLSLDAPTWTLAVQAAFYLVFPLFLLAGILLRRRSWIVPVALIVAGIIWNWVTFKQGGGPIWRLALPAMLPYMAIGMLIAHIPPLGSRSAASTMILGGLGLAVGNSVWHAVGGGGDVVGVLRDIPGAVGFGLIIAGAAQQTIGSSKLFSPLEAFGRWSYGVFLFHLPLLLWLKGHDLMPGSALLTWMLLVAVASAAGALTWRFVERPLLARTRATRSTAS
ncbi:MAG TPA: acyltransferase [Solirubrobacterales bacterium]|nr:acyltransferase [Solirubrobacterales bacterium]